MGFTGVITSMSGVITLHITGSGPPCSNQTLQQGKLIPLRFLPDKHKHHVDSFLCELITFITSSEMNHIGSMYGICTYIWLIFMVNLGKYTIHGSYMNGSSNSPKKFAQVQVQENGGSNRTPLFTRLGTCLFGDCFLYGFDPMVNHH